jgi:hypothetical protein
MAGKSQKAAIQRPHLRLVWSAAENQSDNMRLLGKISPVLEIQIPLLEPG